MPYAVRTYATRLILAIVTFLTNILIARKLGTSGVGNYALIMALGMLLAHLLSFGLESALLYFTSKKLNSRNKLLKFAVTYALSVTLLVAVIMSTLNVFGIFKFQHSYLICLVMMFQMLQSLVIAIKTGEGKLYFVNKCLILCHCIFLIFVAFILPTNYQNYSTIIAVYAFISFILFALITKDVKWLERSPSQIFNKDLFIYARRSYIASISGIIRLRIQIIILSLFALPTSLGVFSVAQSFTEALFILPVMLSSLLIPSISNLEKKDQERTFINFTKFSLYTGLAMLISIQLIAPNIIPFLYGEQYIEVVTVLSVLSISVIFYCINKMIMGFLFAINKPELCSRSEFIAMFIAITCSLALAPAYGAIGIAISAVLSAMSLSIALIFYLKQVSEVRMRDIILLKRDDITLLFENIGFKK